MISIIKKFREIRGYTQNKLAESIGLKDSRVRQYELGIRNPKNDMIDKLAEGLDIKPEYIKEYKYPYSLEDTMRILLKLDDSFDLKTSEIDVVIDENYNATEKKTALYFNGTDGKLIDAFLKDWDIKKEEFLNGEICKEEYEDWKANWPESTNKDYIPNIKNKRKLYADDSIRVNNPLDFISQEDINKHLK